MSVLSNSLASCCRLRRAVRSSSSSGMTPRGGLPTSLIRTPCPRERGVPGGHARAGPSGASQESGRHAPLSCHAGAPGSGDARHRALPVVIELKRLPSTHDGKGIEQELVYARPERLHLRQRPVGPLEEAIVVGAEAQVVLQAREGRQVEDLAESGTTPMVHPMPAADRLAGVAARGIRARQLDELPAVVVFRSVANFSALRRRVPTRGPVLGDIRFQTRTRHAAGADVTADYVIGTVAPRGATAAEGA